MAKLVRKRQKVCIIYDKILEHLTIIREKRSKEMGLQLPEISRKTLCRKTQRAIKTYKLFEKIGIDKIKYLKAYSANSISELTNDQIQKIIDNIMSLICLKEAPLKGQKIT